GYTAAGHDLEVLARATGAAGAEDTYGLSIAGGNVSFWHYTAGYSTYYQVGSYHSVSIAGGDVLTLKVEGTDPSVTLTAYKNGVQVAQETDSDVRRKTTVGSAGLIAKTGSGVASDLAMFDVLWAGSIGGPSASISPSSATLNHGDTQAFSFAGG